MGNSNKAETAPPVKTEDPPLQEAVKAETAPADKKTEFSNPETAKKYKMVGDNWDRRVNIPGIYAGHIRDIHPKAAEALIKQGRTDIVPKELNSPAGATK